MIWHRRSVAALILLWQLAESYVTVTPWITHTDWSHWWYKQAADVVLPSTALAIGSKMSDKHTSPNTIQVKNLWKIINVEEKLDVINQLEEGLRIVDTWCNVWFAHSRVRTIPDNADRI